MRKRLTWMGRALTLLLCLCLLNPAAAFAEEGEEPKLIDPEALEQMVSEYLSQKNIPEDAVSVGYVYTATGDVFYHNPDKWIYAASTYKVPLMMLFAQMEAEGEITQDTVIEGLSLARAEELILVHSNNDYAHMYMSWLGSGSEPECVEQFKQFAQLPEDYYISDFREWRDFTARYLTQVLQTLYNDPERFPHIIDCLKQAQPGEYFSGVWGDQYEVAQKYGSLDTGYTMANHTAGIIYTPHPFILVVMTDHVGAHYQVIQDMARLFGDYTLGLEEQLTKYEAAQEAERLRREEEERRAEEERLAEPQQTQESQAVPESREGSDDSDAIDHSQPQPGAVREESVSGRTPRLLTIVGAAALAVLLLVLRLTSKKKNKVGVR